MDSDGFGSTVIALSLSLIFQAIDSVMLDLFQSSPRTERTGTVSLLLGALESEQLVEVMSSLLAEVRLGILAQINRHKT